MERMRGLAVASLILIAAIMAVFQFNLFTGFSFLDSEISELETSKTAVTEIANNEEITIDENSKEKSSSGLFTAGNEYSASSSGGSSGGSGGSTDNYASNNPIEPEPSPTINENYESNIKLASSGSGVQIPSDGLVAHYNFQGDFNDAAGSNSYGKNPNGVRFLLTGNDNQAAVFDGVDDAFSVVTKEIAIRGNITIAFWIKVNGGKDSFILGKGNNFNLGQYVVKNKYFSNGGNLIFFQRFVKDGSLAVESNANFEFPNYSWHHVVIISSENNVKFFIDGILRNNDAGANKKSGSLYTSLPLSIGGVDESFFNGNLDEILIYSKALIDNEARDIFDAQKDIFNFREPFQECYLKLTIKEDLRDPAQHVFSVEKLEWLNADYSRKVPPAFADSEELQYDYLLTARDLTGAIVYSYTLLSSSEIISERIENGYLADELIYAPEAEMEVFIPYNPRAKVFYLYEGNNGYTLLSNLEGGCGL